MGIEKITEKQVKRNMLELALYLLLIDNKSNVIDMTFRDIHMRFEVWTEKTGKNELDKI